MFNFSTGKRHSVEILRDLVVGLLEKPCQNTISLSELNGHEPKPDADKVLIPIKG